MTLVRRIELGKVCGQDRKTIKPGECRELRYIGLETIESNTGKLLDGELSKTPEIPQANSFWFDHRHVLYGKLRPYLNKVALPTFEGKCSTEIIPILPNAELERAYLAYFLRSPHIVERIMIKTAGARMPRADMNFILGLEIPLPPIEEQRRLVDILTSAESIINLRREALKKTQEIIPALFVDMFGDPAANPKEWPVLSLPETLERPFKNGLYLPKDLYSKEDSMEGVEMVHMSDAFYGEVKRGKLRRVLANAKQTKEYALTSQDLLVARRSLNFDGAAKLCSIPQSNEPLLFESSFIRLTPLPERVLKDYLLYYLNNERTRTRYIISQISGITIFGINQDSLSKIPVMVPNLSVQTSFANRVREICSIQSQATRALATAEATFQALLHRAFAGEL